MAVVTGFDVVVIGAGFAGLSAAVVAASAAHRAAWPIEGTSASCRHDSQSAASSTQCALSAACPMR